MITPKQKRPLPFKIYQENGRQIIGRTSYPRVKGVITFGALSDIEEIEFIDNCQTNPGGIARAVREAGEYLLDNSL